MEELDVEQAHLIPETCLLPTLIPYNMAFMLPILSRKATKMVSPYLNNSDLHKRNHLKVEVSLTVPERGLKPSQSGRVMKKEQPSTQVVKIRQRRQSITP